MLTCIVSYVQDENVYQLHNSLRNLYTTSFQLVIVSNVSAGIVISEF